MSKVPSPISLAGSQLGETRHVCAFFNSDEEEYRVLLPFIKDGLKSGDKVVHVLNPEQRQDHLQRLTAAGIDSPITRLLDDPQRNADRWKKLTYLAVVLLLLPLQILAGLDEFRDRRGHEADRGLPRRHARRGHRRRVHDGPCGPPLQPRPVLFAQFDPAIRDHTR